MTAPVPADVISRLKAVLGEGGWSEAAERIAPKLVEWRDRWVGQTTFLALPRTTAQVAAVVGICAEARQPITIQGGNTGLVGGQIPQGEVLLSTERLRAIREVSPLDDVITAEAGVTLSEIHAAAAAVRRKFPLGLASEGSATVGGFVSTNAGGTQVVRYGVTRNLVLGLEAVLPNGEVWNGLKHLRKDNTGYDLKQLLIGAEGTLGVVTAAGLKLYPQLPSRAVAFLGVPSPEAAIALLARAKDASGGAVEAFELIARIGIDFAVKNIAGTRDPLPTPHPWYVLAEFATAEDGSAERAMQRFLEDGLEAGLIADAVVAQTEAQAKALWAIRENQSPAQKPEGATWKHDVAVPVSAVPAFLREADAAMRAFAPGCRIAAFGHVGDGNIHYDVLRPDGGSNEAHAARRGEGSRIVHDLVMKLGGSISAEHGLGAMKTTEAARYKSPVELQALKAIRQALDPHRILNPRVLF
ncbi:FAD-binding oxidoreductase [Phenylobacterium sp. J426]|uniref:FAD-binding oxidoreductase n=1 Tax=Phenylobacterium sp. J426 TaxID=2898439 RepID=UPI00215178EE|nr:FAD-binding oxidoreductase [Phenylobacterium sp. J426]MCR5873315.1 FAD-binding oxidoreductase [Phenylobacterium sp. J426]